MLSCNNSWKLSHLVRGEVRFSLLQFPGNNLESLCLHFLTGHAQEMHHHGNKGPGGEEGRRMTDDIADFADEGEVEFLRRVL